jgi:NAD-dependent deacetylase
MPANTIPGVAKQAGASIIEINLQRTHLTDSVTDLFLPGKAGEVVPQLVAAVEEDTADS